MSDKCPNCGSGSLQRTSLLAGYRMLCRSCGSILSRDRKATVFVPTRSRPAEVLELPDGGGCWFTPGHPRGVEIFSWQGKPFMYTADGCRHYCEKGQWSRAVPPIIAPAKPDPDPDAEKLRRMADYSSGALVFPISRELAEQFRRIADDLERLKRDAKERA